MIIKGFKKNALKRNIETLLKKRSEGSKDIDHLENLAVLIDATKPSQMDSVEELAMALGISIDNITVLEYKDDEHQTEGSQTSTVCYSDKSFAVNGVIRNSSLKDFINEDFDVLINLYGEDKLELNYIASASKAKLKVGFADIDHRINDLIIGTKVDDYNSFVSELKKYLKILQII